MDAQIPNCQHILWNLWRNVWMILKDCWKIKSIVEVVIKVSGDGFVNIFEEEITYIGEKYLLRKN